LLQRRYNSSARRRRREQERASAEDNDNIVKFRGRLRPGSSRLDSTRAGSGSVIALVPRFEGGGYLRDLLHLVKLCVQHMLERLRVLCEIATGLFFLRRAEARPSPTETSRPKTFRQRDADRRLSFASARCASLSKAQTEPHASLPSHTELAVGAERGRTWLQELYDDDVGISRSSDMYAFGTLAGKCFQG